MNGIYNGSDTIGPIAYVEVGHIVVSRQIAYLKKTGLQEEITDDAATQIIGGWALNHRSRRSVDPESMEATAREIYEDNDARERREQHQSSP